MNKILTLITVFVLSLTAFANDYQPVVVKIDNLDQLGYGYLAQTGKEVCRKDEKKMQDRADAICYAEGHLQAVWDGYDHVEAPNQDLMEISGRYGERQVRAKDYRCKQDSGHIKVLSMRKFKFINCLTER